MGLKGDRTEPSEADAALGRVIHLLSERSPVTIAEAELETGAQLTPTALRDLRPYLTMLATAPCLERPEKRALVCICRHDDADEAVRSDLQLISLLRMRRAEQNQMFSRADLARFVPVSFQTAFSDSFSERERSQRWPVGVGAILRARAMQLFLLSDLPATCRDFFTQSVTTAQKSELEEAPGPVPAPGSAEPRRDRGMDEARPHEMFAYAFERAFVQLDRQTDQGERISLEPLREALSTFDQEQFERGLQFLHSTGRFVLESPAGRCGDLGPAGLASVISEWGESKVYVTKQTS